MNNNIIIFKNSVILFSRLLITSVVGLFTSRYVIHSLGASDFGLYNVVGSVVVMAAFLNTSMITTSYRYIAFELGKGNKGDVNNIFNISLVIHLCLAVIVVIVAITVGEFYIHNYLKVDYAKIPDALFVFRFSILATFFNIISVPYQGLITAQENFLIRAMIEIIRSLLGLVVAVILVFYAGNRLQLYAILMSLVTLIPFLLLFFYSRNKYAKIVRWNFQPKIAKYKEMLSFSGWIMFGAGASVGKIQGAALIINSFFGTLLNAAYGIANQINSLVLAFSQNISQAAIPQITKSFSSGNSERTIELVSYISKYSFFLLLLPCLPVLLEANYLLNLWLVEVPEYTLSFTTLLIINALIGQLGAGIPAAVQATGKIKYFQIILSTNSLLCLPIAYFFFLKGYSPNAIFLVYIFMASVNVIVRQILLKRLIKFKVKEFLKISYQKICYVLVLVAPLFFIRSFFSESLTRFIVLSISSIVWLLFVVYMVGLEKREKRIIQNTLVSFKNKHFL